MNKYEMTDEIREACFNELKRNKIRSYYNNIVDNFGWAGLVYACLENMDYHGRYVYPMCYKYRRHLARAYREYIQDACKRWTR